MNAPVRILVVIPVYNHGRTLAQVVRECRTIHEHVIVVDDGSTDLSEDLVRGLEVPVLRHTHNQGKGQALMTGARYGLDNGFTHMVSMDADCQHRPKDFFRFKSAVAEDPTALIVGRRDFSSTWVPRSSRFGRQFSNFWFRVQTGRSAGDAQSGFRAYPLFVLDQLSLAANRYDFEVEVLVKAAWAGIPVKAIDIGVHYQPSGQRVSHFKLFLDNLRLTRLNTRLTLRSFLPWPHKQLLEKNPREAFSILRPMDGIRHFLAYELSPAQIAWAGAMGVFLGTLPLVALHSLAILMAAGFFRLNKIVALGASQFCMPPIVPALCIEAGYFMTHGGTFLTEISLQTLGYQFLDRFMEWVLGSLVLAPVLAGLTFVILYIAASAAVAVPQGD